MSVIARRNSPLFSFRLWNLIQSQARGNIRVFSTDLSKVSEPSGEVANRPTKAEELTFQKNLDQEVTKFFAEKRNNNSGDFIVTKLDAVANFMRTGSMWPMAFGLA